MANSGTKDNLERVLVFGVVKALTVEKFKINSRKTTVYDDALLQLNKRIGEGFSLGERTDITYEQLGLPRRKLKV